MVKRPRCSTGSLSDDELRETGKVGPNERIARRLSVDVPVARALHQALVEDLAPERGIAWWHPVTDDCGPAARRTAILVADHLTHAAGALPDFLLEARLHLMDLIDAWAGQDEKWKDYYVADGSPRSVPATRSIADDLDQVQDDLHITGFFRALAQTLDCLASVIIGVADLEAKIQAASRGPINNEPEKLKTQPAAVGETAARLRQAQLEAGPEGWLTWVVDMRNMLMHRPRMLDLTDQKFGDAPPRSEAELRQNFRLVHHLPRFPTHSLVESFVLGLQDLRVKYLGEDAQVTLEGAVASTGALVDQSCEALLNLWLARRADAALQPQYHLTVQWKKKPPPGDGFSGFETESTTFEVGEILINSQVGDRLIAAGIDDERRGATWGNAASD